MNAILLAYAMCVKVYSYEYINVRIHVRPKYIHIYSKTKFTLTETFWIWFEVKTSVRVTKDGIKQQSFMRPKDTKQKQTKLTLLLIKLTL